MIFFPKLSGRNCNRDRAAQFVSVAVTGFNNATATRAGETHFVHVAVAVKSSLN